MTIGGKAGEGALFGMTSAGGDCGFWNGELSDAPVTEPEEPWPG